ncbi:MAG: vitamin K epoxide reductase family protein [Patescibacteria group bacterium]
MTQTMGRGMFFALALATLIGFLDALYLTITHYANTAVPCYVGSCEKVLTSSYSVVLGIPIAVYGVVFYLVTLVLLAYYFESKKPIALTLALLATPFGFFASVYFFVLQAWIIQAWCQYCILSGITSTLMFGIALVHYVKGIKKDRPRLASDQ